MNHSRTKILLAPVAAVALTFTLAACGSDSDSSSSTEAASGTGADASAEVTITDAWIREPAEGQTASAAYATITNDSGEDITLVGASAPVGGDIQIHETLMDDDGTMTMKEKTDGFVIAAGDSFTLEPGGPHVMFMGIEPTEITGTIDVTFVFESGLELTVPAEVRVLDGGDMDDMDDMDHDDMDDMDDDMEMDETESTG